MLGCWPTPTVKGHQSIQRVTHLGNKIRISFGGREIYELRLYTPFVMHLHLYSPFFWGIQYTCSICIQKKVSNMLSLRMISRA